MNPTFTVSVDLVKRKTSVMGLVAVGEKVNVVISGFGDYSVPEWEPDNTEGFSGAALRFRLVAPDGKDLVRFPLAEGDKWGGYGGEFSAEVDFNTMQLRKWLRGFPIDGKAEVGVIVDSVVDAMVYGRGTVKILQWAASPAEDPTILPDWRETLRNLNAAIVEISSKTERAESAAQTAQAARNDAQTSKGSAETAANNALSSANSAKGFKNDAESASARASTSAEEAKASQSAAESAKGAAESARDEAKGYAEAAADKLANAATKAELQAEVERAKTAEQSLENKVTGVSSKVDTVIGGDPDKSARTIAAEEVAKVVANAPQDLDTLKEIADYIESDKTNAAQMVADIDVNAKAISAVQESLEGKVDKSGGKINGDVIINGKLYVGNLPSQDPVYEVPSKGYVGRTAINLVNSHNNSLLAHNELFNSLADDYNTKLDGKVDKTSVVKPTEDSPEGAVAGAKATYEALAGKASSADATLTERGFGPWVLADGVNNPITGDWLEEWQSISPSATSGEVTIVNNQIYIGGVSSTSPQDVSQDGLSLVFNGLGWANVGRALGISVGDTVATRERLPGYILGSQIEKPLQPAGNYATVDSALPRYPFVDAAIVDGVVTVAPFANAKLTSDGTAFTVAVGGTSEYMRDCVLRVECGETAPTITWGANFHPRTDAETDFKCEAGKRNIYWITEHAEGEFAVAGWQATTGGNAQ